eukprot:g1004.t1
MRRKRESKNEDVFFESNSQSETESIENVETIEEKRLKLAKDYLKTLRDEFGDDEDQMKLYIQEKEDNQLERQIASFLDIPEDHLQSPDSILWPLTALAVDSSTTSIYTVDKNGGVAIYDTETGSKSKFHFDRDFTRLNDGRKPSWVSKTGSYGIPKRAFVTCALSCDSKLLVVAGGDRQIHVLDPKSKRHIKSLSGHQEAISGVTFQKGSHQLFSCGYDRTVRVWNLDDFSFVDTLFGHQSEVCDIDMMHLEKLLTVGNDRSCRIWKTHNDSQLVFRAPTLSMECGRFLNSTHFISASSDGLQLWNIAKKKPIYCTSPPRTSPMNSSSENGWIQSLAAIHQSDLIGSGSADGSIKLWKANGNPGRWNSLERLGLGLEAPGIITALHLSKDGQLVIGAQSREPRLGNWNSSSTNTRNAVVIYRLKRD